ncbi:MAG: DUF1698 domain-containing protein, partial [Sulfurovaceae bacterium]
MNLDELRRERQKCLSWKNIAPINSTINALDEYKCSFFLDDIVDIQIENISKDAMQEIEQSAKMMKPWRKGPFKINELLIDSEWRSD